MIILYYTSTILLSWSLKLPLEENNGFRNRFNSLDIFDRKQFFIYVCVAQCLHDERKVERFPRISLNTFKDCIRNCERQDNSPATIGSKVQQIHENYVLDLICREEKRLHFRVNLLLPVKSGKMEENPIYVIKLNTMNNSREYKVYLVSRGGFYIF